MTPVTGRRQLIVMRHAKAEPFASTDHARALTDRGHADAAAVGTWLSEAGAVPDHAVVSTAVRARETWFDVARASGAGVEPSFDQGLYHGGVDAALEALHAAPEDAMAVIVVGHNPTAAYVAHLLDDGTGDPTAIREMLKGYPANAMAVLELEVPWSDLGPETGRLIDFHVARA